MLTAKAVLTNSSRSAGASTPTYTVSKPGLEISYNAATQTYSLRAVLDPRVTRPDTASFGPAERQAAANLGEPGYDASTVSGGDTNVSKLQVALATRLTYSDIGLWRTGVTRADGSQSFADLYFSYGVQTLASDMPKSGTGRYAVDLVGTTPGASVGGTGTVTANFGAATVSVDLSPTYVYGPGNVSQIGTLSGTGAISANGFAADIAGAGHTGDVNGLFYGPQASEIGGIFTFSSPAVSGGAVSSGAFAGKRD